MKDVVISRILLNQEIIMQALQFLDLPLSVRKTLFEAVEYTAKIRQATVEDTPLQLNT